MKHIITIQHTQSIQHTNDMIGSWTDWDLTDLGHEQAKRIGEKLCHELKNEQYALYTSDLLRARHTAEHVSNALDTKPIFDERLREFYFGEACGKTKQWAKENGKTATDPFCNSIDERPFAGAETLREAWNRLNDFYHQTLAKTGGRFIIVSHGGTLGMFYALWLGMDAESFFRYELRSNAGGVSFLREDDNGKRTIHRLNDRSYMNE